MSKQWIQVLLLLLMIVPVIGITYEQTEEYAQKRAILNEKAARFKAETGFVGEIRFNYQSMTFSSLRGNFGSINVTVPQDTLVMNLVFDQVVSKVISYISASVGQLNKEELFKNPRRTGITYRQIVNGYRVHGAGSLNIAYTYSTKQFIVTDNTVIVELERVPINITLDQAIQIAIKRYDPEYNYDTRYSLTQPATKLVYAKIPGNSDKLNYKLCYMISFWGLTVFISPETGEILGTSSIIAHDYQGYVEGYVYEQAYTGNNVNSLGYSPVPCVTINTTNFTGSTDLNGQVTVTDDTLSELDVVLQYLGLLSQTEYPDTLRVVKANPDDIDIQQDSVIATFHDNNCNTMNTYYHSIMHFLSLDSISPFSSEFTSWRLISNVPYSGNINGECDPNNKSIRISSVDGKYSLLARHELSHAFVWNKLDNNFFHNTDESRRAMDEAFAVYLPCSIVNSPLFITTFDSSSDIMQYTVDDVKTNFYQSDTIDEEFYDNYFCRYPIASAWWEIRSRVDLFDYDLIDALTSVSLNGVSEDMRCKPRYFYNILMNDSIPTNQHIIDKAYSDRGLHFTPQVISAGISNPLDGRDKNLFRIGDPVYVKITNCPQNTPLTVYVVENQDYTDGMNISTLNNIIHQIPGTSGPDGVWYSSTPVMTASTVGDYDILVDIGNNGVLHFAYIEANVRDGFDGLDGSGFTVYDDGIDVVLALDLSQSMVEECAVLGCQVVQCGRHFLGK